MNAPKNGQQGQRPTNGSANSNSDVQVGCMVFAAIGFVVFLVSQCSSDTASTASTDAASAAPQAIATAIATQSLPPVEVLNRVSVRKGAADLKKAAREGLAGEMIYSQNCYDALSRHFTWSKLDTCGAFDAVASLSLEDDALEGTEKETAWLQSEAAAGRYLKAAISAGEGADEADQRLEALQARAAKARPAAPRTSSASTEASSEAAPSPSGDLGTQSSELDIR